MQEHRIEYINIKEVRSADVNPKQHDIGVLHQSMDRFGFIMPIIRNEATGKLVGGHGRIETLRQKYMLDKKNPPKGIRVDEEGEWFVPMVCGISFESDIEADAYLIADNRLVELGGWEPPELKDLIEKIAVESGTLDGIGFDDEDLQQLFEDLSDNVDEKLENDVDPLKVSIKFDNEGQRDDWIRFLKWLKNSSDLQTDGERIAEFIRNVI